MNFRGGMNELVRQAARMQRKVDDIKKSLKDKEVTGTAAGEKVTVVVTCEGKLRSIVIDPEFLAGEGIEMALDAVVVACNAALETADKLVEGEIKKVTGSFNVPGLPM
jgi:DNA-binding YbaB/EbfC family protein